MRFVARTVERFGRLDVMMCNAGFGIAGAIDDIAPEQMQKLMDINYTGTYHATRAALPLFRRQRSGHFIIVSSIVGKRGVPLHGRLLGDQVRAGRPRRVPALGAASARGIHVSVVYPVSTETEFFDVMSRETGTTVTRACGPRQRVGRGRRRDRASDPSSDSRNLPARQVARARDPQRARARFTDRMVKRFGRKPVRREQR